ncbi:MAG: RHS repeat-associated core domain-containing protein [Acidobacteria bacterium]|nr:RHS repeat-associated core domain-containing protein [Acidobacteriota bacterium]
MRKHPDGLRTDNKLKLSTTSGSTFFLQDHLRSTIGLTNATGSLTATQSYDSFGNPTNASFPTRFQYTGREFDNFTGLQFSRARFYAPNLGRFISEDPIGFNGGDVNLYGYVGNNPIRKNDPLGQFPFTPLLPPVTFRNPGLAQQLNGYNPWIGGEIGGALHLFPLPGPKGSVGLEINPLTGEVCFYVKLAARVGFGYYVGGGLQGTAAFGPSSRGVSGGPTVEVGADVAVPDGLKGHVSSGFGGSAGLDGVGAGIGPAVGLGFSAGADVGYKYYFKCYFTPCQK